MALREILFGKCLEMDLLVCSMHILLYLWQYIYIAGRFADFLAHQFLGPFGRIPQVGVDSGND